MHNKKSASKEFSNQPFKDLKKLLRNKNLKISLIASGHEMSKRSSAKHVNDVFVNQGQDVQLNDERIFSDAMKGVQEIREFRDIRVRKIDTSFVSKHGSAFPEQKALKALEEIVKGRRAVELSDTQEYVEWMNPDFREDVVKKLHEGHYSVQDCLDLHGIILEEAEKEVENFFKESIRKGCRCIKIIHGRGLRSANGPVLKKALVKWLMYRHRKNIVAFVTARQCDGGLGALYVLLN